MEKIERIKEQEKVWRVFFFFFTRLVTFFHFLSTFIFCFVPLFRTALFPFFVADRWSLKIVTRRFHSVIFSLVLNAVEFSPLRAESSFRFTAFQRFWFRARARLLLMRRWWKIDERSMKDRRQTACSTKFYCDCKNARRISRERKSRTKTQSFYRTCWRNGWVLSERSRNLCSITITTYLIFWSILTTWSVSF